MRGTRANAGVDARCRKAGGDTAAGLTGAAGDEDGANHDQAPRKAAFAASAPPNAESTISGFQ